MNEEDTGIFSCRNICWIAGGLIGLAAFLLILRASVIGGLVVGVVLAVALAIVLKRLFCLEGPAAAHHTIAGAAAVTTGAGASGALDHDEDAEAAAAAAASAMTGDEEVAAAIAGDMARTTPAAALDAAALKADEPAHTHKEVEPTAAAKPAPVSGESQPGSLLDAPRGGQADDLKKIKGVGPGLEKKMNELGIWHFDQLAGLGAEEIAWVDDRLKFKGRIERDDWVKQAKALAEKG